MSDELVNQLRAAGRSDFEGLIAEAADRIEAVQKIVNEQAEDAGVWFVAQTAAGAYLQQELRRLHAAIEGKTPEECALTVLAGQPPQGGRRRV